MTKIRRPVGCLTVASLAFLCVSLGRPVEAACPPEISVPVVSGSAGLPILFSFAPGTVQGSFFLLGAGDLHNSGDLPSSAWFVPLGDLDGDGRIEYRLDAPGQGAGGWGDPRAIGCPASADPPFPPLVLILSQAREDFDGDGLFDIFEDANHNGLLDPGEDRDRDGRLTPDFVRTIDGRVPGCEGVTREDVDCDRHLDRFYEDANGNHLLDITEDRDGDHRLDYIDEDRNHNGLLDPGEDRNGNGRLDTFDPAFPDIQPYIEDRNNDQILNDRVRILYDDVFVEYDDDHNVIGVLPATYPYGEFRPAPGGLVVASAAWTGSAYDFDAINTPTRLITLDDGREYRVVDAQPPERFVPRVSSVRQDEVVWPFRLHVDPSRLQRVDDLLGARAIFDQFALTLLGDLVPGLGEVFLESLRPETAIPEKGAFVSVVTTVPPGFLPGVSEFQSRARSAGSDDFLSRSGLPVPIVFQPLDQDGDGLPLPMDNCPAVPNTGQIDFSADGIGDACDPSTDPQAAIENTWVTGLTGTDPGARVGAAAAYDAARARLVLFGGEGDSSTWEFDGASWTRLDTDPAPEPRWGHRMAYDPNHARILLFGGARFDGGPLNDLWQYADQHWTRIETPISPPPRTQRPFTGFPGGSVFGLAYDASRNLLVLFGGDETDRTWVFDGSNWKIVASPRAPLPRTEAQMAYDSFRKVIVLQGGYDLRFAGQGQGRLFNDTWEFDGLTWQEVDSRGDTPPSWGSVMAFDPGRRRLMSFGGEAIGLLRLSSGSLVRQLRQSAATRLYDGATWSFLPTRPTNSPQVGHAGGFDPARGTLLVHGSFFDLEGTRLGDTAELRLPSDTDGDGVEDREDDCPLQPNADQADRDGDGSGDACDDCVGVVNPTQRDLDRDGLGDACDEDIDGDGVLNGDDACPSAYVAGRPVESILGGGGPDGDGDGVPDDCDACPSDPANDSDGDGLCVAADNCPTAFNPLQEDSNHDGSGDACQPIVILNNIRQDGGNILEVDASASDPNGDPLSGRIEFTRTTEVVLRAIDFVGGDPCDSDIFPPDHAGKGIAYAAMPGGGHVLGDLDSTFVCVDGEIDYLIAPGRCSESADRFSTALTLGDVPEPICIGRAVPGAPSAIVPGSEVDLTVASHGDASVLLIRRDPVPALVIPFANGLPQRSALTGLASGSFYTMAITVTDGSTVPVTAAADFYYQGESILQIGGGTSPPHAVISGSALWECDRPLSGRVLLDGSGSSDPDSGQAGLTFAWYEDLGLPTERLLGTAVVLDAVLSLGAHRISLRVTNSSGLSDTAAVVVTVQDTIPPSLVAQADPSSLKPPNHRLVDVQVGWQVQDVCDPSPQVTLISATSNELDDAPGNGDGSTTGDIEGADIGTADTLVRLRAERSGGGSGRQYELTYSARDVSGNVASATAVVSVASGPDSVSEPLALWFGAGSSRGSARLYWSAVAGAAGYDAVRGDLSSLRLKKGRTLVVVDRVLARGTSETSTAEPAANSSPPAGHAFFYLVQYRDATGDSGYGTVSAPWPLDVSLPSTGSP